jgi:Spy/CpxP family protein refolding chaperone
MSLSTKVLSLLGVAAAALCLSSSAFAQDQAPPAAPDGMAHHGLGHQGMDHQGADREAWRKAREEHRAHFLHDILEIRSDQEAAFQTFMADMKPPMRDHKDWAARKDGADHEDAAAASLTTPERLDRMAAMMEKRTAERQAAFQKRSEAIKRFYAVLSPEQKRAFDALHGHGGMGHGGHGMGRHHDGSEGGPGGHEQGEG